LLLAENKIKSAPAGSRGVFRFCSDRLQVLGKFIIHNPVIPQDFGELVAGHAKTFLEVVGVKPLLDSLACL